jgi:phage-related protein
VADTLAEAAVEIVADTERFPDDLKRGVDKGVKSATKDIDKAMRRSGESAGENLGEGVERGSSRRLKGARKTFDREGRRGGQAFGDGFESEFTRFGSRLRSRLNDLFTRGGLFTSVAKSVTVLTSALASFTPVTPAIIGAAAALVAVSGAIVQASAAAIPAAVAFSSLGLAMAAVKVGSQGLGDALKAQSKALEELAVEGKVSEATQKKLDAALKNLSPSARALVLQLGKLAPAWEKVRRVVQDNLFKGTATQIRLLASKFLPLLQVQLGGAAARLNAAFTSLSQFLRSGEQATRIGTIFSGLNRVLGILLGAIRPLTDAFLKIFEGSLPGAQRIATAITALAVRFDQFISRVTASGQFQSFLDTAIDLAGTLLRLFGNIGKVLLTIFQAGSAQGGGLLKLLADLTGQLNTFLNSAAGQSALASFFSLIAQAGRTVQDVFGVLGPLFSGLGAIFSALSPVLAQLRAAILPVALALSKTLGAALTALAPLLAQLLGAVVPLVAALGQGLVSVLQAVLLAVLPILPALTQFATTVLTALTPQIPVLADALVQVALAFGQILISLLPALPAFTQLVVALVPLIPALAQIVVGLAQIVAALAPAIVFFAQMSAKTTGLITVLVQFGVKVVAVGAQVGAALAGMLASGISWAGGMLSAVARVIAAFGRFVGRVASFVAQVIGFLARLAAVVPGLLVRGFTAGHALVVGALGRIVSAVGKFVSDVLGRLRSGLGAVGEIIAAPFRAALGPVSSALNAVLGAIEGFVGKINSAINKVKSAIGNIPKPDFPIIDIPGFMAGGAVTKPTLATIGERSRKEVILPVTNPGRTRKLAEQNPEILRILGPMLRNAPSRRVVAGGKDASQGSRAPEVKHIHLHLSGVTDPDQIVDIIENRLGEKFGKPKPLAGLTIGGLT